MYLIQLPKIGIIDLNEANTRCVLHLPGGTHLQIGTFSFKAVKV
jgi:hypothetical protein